MSAMPLRIAQLAPPWFPVPPTGYGGIEIVINDLVNGLVADGQLVHLLAPGDSVTTATLTAIVPRHLGLDFSLAEKVGLMRAAATLGYERARDDLRADVLHDHTDERPFDDLPFPIVRTIHGPPVEEIVRRYAGYSACGDAFVAISSRQRELFEEASLRLCGRRDAVAIVGAIHNPLDVTHVPFQEVKEEFALFVGRADWEKNPDGAIRIARAAGVPLVMALRVNLVERPYFEQAVKPLLGPDVSLLAEVTPGEKFDLLKRAKVVIFSSQWEEPFGLVMLEAMAAGTPVLALRRGAAPEIIRHGVTGFLGDSEEELAGYIGAVGTIAPRACREHVLARFNPASIAQQYLAVYRRALGERGGNRPYAGGSRDAASPHVRS